MVTAGPMRSKALARGMAGKLPASWRPAEENAAVEVWLTIHGAMAVCGLRLSDRTMRHRLYKVEHLPASLRPTVAAAMVRLADLKPGQTVLDPMCGAGTLLAEAILYAKARRTHDGEPWTVHVLGGDIEAAHARAAAANLSRFGDLRPLPWDARQLPVDDGAVDRILCNPPFGKQLASPEEIAPLYRQAIREMDRVLRRRRPGRIDRGGCAGADASDRAVALAAGAASESACARPARKHPGVSQG